MMLKMRLTSELQRIAKILHGQEILLDEIPALNFKEIWEQYTEIENDNVHPKNNFQRR